jgi:hypothetical protein
MISSFIHGIPCYGKFNDHHFRALAKAEATTTKEQWEGITGIYCTDGYTPVSGPHNNGHYITFWPSDNTEESFREIHEDLMGELRRRDIVVEDNHTYQSPFIYVHGDKIVSEQDFLFVLLHELGHHQYDEYKGDLSHKELEILCNKFSMQILVKIYSNVSLAGCPEFIHETLDEMGLTYNSTSQVKQPETA